MDVHPWVWGVSLVVTLVVLSFDVWWAMRNPHVPSRKETTTFLSIYVGAAVLFGIGVWVLAGGQYGTEFFAGWLTEYSLSIDNLFIFLIIMSSFGVPRKYQQDALLWGIIIALVLRAIFIAVGASAINAFSWVFYIFGAFLIYTAVKLFLESINDTDEDDFEENGLIRFAKKHLPSTDSWEGGTSLFLKENGKRLITPMFLTILALGSTDLLFALDSIPAIFGLTQEPYLVLMANVFALMGLRQLYFLLGDLLQRLVYLGIGLAVLLAFIGLKLIFHAMHENELPFINGGEHIAWAPDIPIAVSLGAIVVILGVTTIASLWKSRKDERAGHDDQGNRIDGVLESSDDHL
ncbi:tellurite resistance protein TerC [Kytococcus aerolatus]|uniref:Tellurite resistance protein TerC n=1 Tax=Kytococcus aerolatus TaxID=592308 RepID=A0A212T0B2_9MICO|nr:TerC family protein [Kytococcus aerolatus]SNC59445.1 tellurite resistance protein TerC [Kytococcus aerolatus]